MMLLAIIRKHQLYNRLLCMKRTAPTILLSTMQLNEYDIFRNVSTNDNSNRIQSENGTCSVDKPPERPDIGVCCESGCKNCVWFKYVVEVKFYYENDKKKMQEALNSIPDPDIKAFVEMELRKGVTNS